MINEQVVACFLLFNDWFQGQKQQPITVTIGSQHNVAAPIREADKQVTYIVNMEC